MKLRLLKSWSPGLMKPCRTERRIRMSRAWRNGLGLQSGSVSYLSCVLVGNLGIDGEAFPHRYILSGVWKKACCENCFGYLGWKLWFFDGASSQRCALVWHFWRLVTRWRTFASCFNRPTGKLYVMKWLFRSSLNPRKGSKIPLIC